jgi:FHA domain
MLAHDTVRSIHLGILERMHTGERVTLRSRVVLGRSASCDLRVDDARVSSEHASLGWTGAGWAVRDLGSKNGTFVGERRIAVGERIPLLPGDVLTLGAPRPPAPAFVLADGGPPTASARHTQTGRVRVASTGLIVLPDDENPRASVVLEHDGSWGLEAQGACVTG